MNFLIAFILTWILAFNAIAADVLPSGVVKVTKANNPDCVEYISYKNEMYCSLKALNTTPMDPKLMDYEKQNIAFDDRAWTAAWGEHKDYITSIEYLPVGDDINNWHELITSQFMPGLKDVSAKEFANRFLASLKKSGVVYTAQIIEQQNNLVILEFKVQQPHNLQQDELQKIVKTADGIYILHYAIKKADMGEKNRKKWLGHLKDSSLKK